MNMVEVWDLNGGSPGPMPRTVRDPSATSVKPLICASELDRINQVRIKLSRTCLLLTVHKD